MQGKITWYAGGDAPTRYDVSSAPIDTKYESVRDTVMRLLVNDWDTFGEPGDSLVITCDEG